MPFLFHPGLEVRRVVSGLTMPTSMAFLSENDFLVLEKSTGIVQRIRNGRLEGSVLDLSVNSSSERGLLGIALHPDFPGNPGVYLFWTCRSTALPTDPFMQSERTCQDSNMTGPDSNELLRVPLLGNRVDRFRWTGSQLVFERNLIMLRAFQNDAAPVPANQGDAAQPVAGNHDGGIILFGSDRKLYIIIGDVGRRGMLQNLASGPTAAAGTTASADDQFGGPEPDDAHLTGVILRLNDDGSAPADNPFANPPASFTGEAQANLRKVFAYGIRNSFGMAVDPMSGNLWYQDNGEDAFDEINRVEPGLNAGWIQVMGPISRMEDYKAIETTSLHGNEPFPNLQQFRWGPERIANTPDQARSRLFMLPGARYKDPELSWKFVVAPAAIGFATEDALGRELAGDLFVGLSRPEPAGGALFRIPLSADRRSIAPRASSAQLRTRLLGLNPSPLDDTVADNLDFQELTESEEILFGRDFGVVTDIESGPAGNLYIVSLSHGAVYAIARPQNPEEE
jgi:glucose/arabinose dehydrogenase